MMKLNNRGVTLVELMVTVAIVAVLLVTLGFQFVSWKSKYDVERTIRELYTSLTEARARAMQTSRAHFFDISPDGRYYRITDDNGNPLNIIVPPAAVPAKLVNGDGTFTQQAAWAAIQVSNPVNWGAVVTTTDTTINQLSRRIDLRNNPAAAWVAFNSQQHAGLLIGFFSFPQYGFTFRLGFDKRGLSRNMISSIDPNTGAFQWWAAPAATIQNAVPTGHPNWLWGNPTICIFTDYDGNMISDTDPDYDCIIVAETKTSLGKIITQNTGGDWCREANCAVK
jgi:prepilin-type N-terminal cleavage/methylation domain-containing protein